MNLKSFRFFILVVGLALFLIPIISKVYASHSWGGYHWAHKSSSFTLQLVDSVTTSWNSYLGTTSTDWSASTVLDATVVSGNDSSSTRKRCPAVLGKDRVCNAAYGNNGWLGLAQVWVYSDGHIAQGVVKVNDTYFSTSTYNTPAWRNFVMCQEVGHTLGLDHQDEIFDNPNLGTCMDYTNNPSTNQHPNLHDYAQLETNYTHLDGFTTLSQSVSGTGNGRADVDLSDPGAWGKAIRTSSDGRPSLYVRDLGRDDKVFTFVIWAQE